MDFLEAEGWHHQAFPSLPLIRCSFEGESGQWHCFIRPHKADNQLILYAHFPVEVPDDRRQNAALLLTRINCGLRLGAFELDMNIGQIRFRTGLSFADTTPDHALIRQLFHINHQGMDTHLPILMHLVKSDKSLRELVAMVRDLNP